VPRTHLLAYDITTGDLVTSFNHQLDGQVRGVAASPDGSRIYVTGDFTKVDGQWRMHVAAFNTSDGSLVAGFRPVLGSAGLAVAASDTTVYVGGNFEQVSPKVGAELVSRSHLAAFAASDGTVRDFKADANAPVTALAVTAAGDRLAVGGRFTSLSGTSFYGLGSVDPTTGAAQSFPVNTYIRNAGAQTSITSLYADATGIYGTGYHYGGTGNLEGTFRADPSTGDLLWVADCYGDTYSVFQTGGVVYDASHHHDCSSTPGGFKETSPRSYHFAGAYTVEATGTDSGSRGYAWNHKGQPAPTMFAWYPDFMTGYYTGANQGPWSVVGGVVGDTQYVSYGGEFQAVNSKKIQQGLVRFAAPAPLPEDPNQEPVASFTATADGLRVTVDGTASTDDSAVASYSWTFGDGTAEATGATASHPYASAGTYQVTLTVTDDKGTTGTATQQVTVTAPTPGEPEADPEVAEPAVTPVPGAPVAWYQSTVSGMGVSLDGSGSCDCDGEIVSYQWEFGDGTTGEGVTATHTYAREGTYRVVLIVTDNKGLVSAVYSEVAIKL
jgi:PKD repeat protein